MKIDLEYPFSEMWNKGYIVINSENRRNVILYNSHKDRSTVSYARYLMSVHLGRFLLNSECVDHIDEDKTNDVIENLQILSAAENTRKNVRFITGGRKYVILRCPICRCNFERCSGQTQLVSCNKGRISCCSKNCSSKFKQIRNNLDEELSELVSESQILTIYRK